MQIWLVRKHDMSVVVQIRRLPEITATVSQELRVPWLLASQKVGVRFGLELS